VTPVPWADRVVRRYGMVRNLIIYTIASSSINRNFAFCMKKTFCGLGVPQKALCLGFDLGVVEIQDSLVGIGLI